MYTHPVIFFLVGYILSPDVKCTNKGEASMTTKSEQLNAAAGKVAQMADVEFAEQPMNVGNIERLASILAGAVGLLLLSRRLFVYVTLALLSAYLVFRGISGRCMLYTRANINTRSEVEMGDDLAGAMPNTAADPMKSAMAGYSGSTLTDRIDSDASEDSEIQRWMDERALDPVEQASWESFPASDPPGVG
jgi:hypothetical protein